MCSVASFIYGFVHVHACVHVRVCTGWFRRNLPYCRRTSLKLSYINITKNTCI